MAVKIKNSLGSLFIEFVKRFKLKLFSFTAFFLSFALISSPSFALVVSSEFAQINKKHKGSNGKTLLLIQEAHVDYNAQKAIASTLGDLAQHEGLQLVMVEGGWGNVSLSYLRDYGTTEGRLKVAEEYLQAGKISGEEYLDITTEQPLDLWGVEDPKLYEKNMNAFLGIHGKQKVFSGELSKIERQLETMKKDIFPASLHEFLEKKKTFENHSLSFGVYLNSVIKSNPDKQILKKYPSLEKMLALSGAHEGVDLEKVEWEKQEIIRLLSKSLTKPELESLFLSRVPQNPNEELDSLERLFKALKGQKKLAKKVRAGNLQRYASSLKEMVQGDSKNIFQELESLEQETALSLAETPDQKNLLKVLQSFTLIKKLFELQLTPADFEKLGKTPSDYKPSTWGVIASDQLEKSIPEAAGFYQAAMEREQALIANALKKFEQSGNSLAALITGGFHAEKIYDDFAAQGYSVILISPRFTPSDLDHQQEKYFEILKYKAAFHSTQDQKLDNVNDFLISKQGGISQHAAQ